MICMTKVGVLAAGPAGALELDILAVTNVLRSLATCTNRLKLLLNPYTDIAICSKANEEKENG